MLDIFQYKAIRTTMQAIKAALIFAVAAPGLAVAPVDVRLDRLFRMLKSVKKKRVSSEID